MNKLIVILLVLSVAVIGCVRNNVEYNNPRDPDSPNYVTPTPGG